MEFTIDQIREAVFDHMRELYSRRTRPNIVTRLAMFLGEKKPIEGLIIAEREAADKTSLLCSGAVLRAWTLDSVGLNAIEPSDAKPVVTKGRYWPRGLVEFCIPTDNSGVIVNEMEGPQRGLLYLTDPRARHGKVTLRMMLARSVDSGKKKRGAHGGPP